MLVCVCESRWGAFIIRALATGMLLAHLIRKASRTPINTFSVHGCEEIGSCRSVKLRGEWNIWLRCEATASPFRFERYHPSSNPTRSRCDKKRKNLTADGKALKKFSSSPDLRKPHTSLPKEDVVEKKYNVTSYRRQLSSSPTELKVDKSQ